MTAINPKATANDLIQMALLSPFEEVVGVIHFIREIAPLARSTSEEVYQKRMAILSRINMIGAGRFGAEWPFKVKIEG